MRKTRIVHIITGLNTGGAELSLCKLVEHMDTTRFGNAVISLLPEGPVASRLRSAGIPVYSIGMRRSPTGLFGFFRLLSLLGELSPDVVQTWMYHANFLGGLAGFLRKTPVLWNIRHFNLDPALNKKTTLWLVKVCARFSHTVPRKIVCCAQRALDVHAGVGYDPDKLLVIPNGFDLDAFKPDAQAYVAFRRELGLPADALLVGVIARFDPQKDHENFFRAARLVSAHFPSVRFVLCGDGIVEENPDLVRMIDEKIRRDVFLLGRRDDIPRIAAALDLFVLSSAGEAFPSVLGESMACEVPCVVTDVGDSALIVGDTGLVVPPCDSNALAEAIASMLGKTAEERTALGKRGRRRIMEKYEIGAIAREYETLYEETLFAFGGL